MTDTNDSTDPKYTAESVKEGVEDVKKELRSNLEVAVSIYQEYKEEILVAVVASLLWKNRGLKKRNVALNSALKEARATVKTLNAGQTGLGAQIAGTPSLFDQYFGTKG